MAGWTVPLALAATVAGWLGTRGRVIPHRLYLTLAVAALVVALAGAATIVYAVVHASAGEFASA